MTSFSKGMFLSFFLFLTATAFSSLSTGLQAQENPTVRETSIDEINKVLQDENYRGAKIFVVNQANPLPQPGVKMSPQAAMIDMPIEARTELLRLLGRSGQIAGELSEGVKRVVFDTRPNWLPVALLTALGGLAVGWLLGRQFRQWSGRYLSETYSAEPAGRSEKFSYLLLRGLATVACIGISALVALTTIIAFDSGFEPARMTAFIVVGCVLTFQLVREVVFWSFLTPDLPGHRMIGLEDADAKGLYRDLSAVILITTTLAGLCLWMGALDVGDDAIKFSVIVWRFFSIGLLSIVVVKYRRSIANYILGDGPRHDKPLMRRVLAQGWHIIALLYMSIALVVSTVRVALDLPSGTGLVAAPFFILLGALTVHGVALIAIDKVYAARNRKGWSAYAVDAAAASGPSPQGGAPPPSEQPPDQADAQPVFRQWWEHGVAVAIFLVSLGILGQVWGLTNGQGAKVVIGLYHIVSMAFIAYFAYGAVNIFFARKIKEESIGTPVPGEPGEEMSGRGASRLVTLLPLFRSLLTITILSVAAMVMLSEMGVNVGPLFAGAGIVGLAIGFGAQTLIKDMFAGVFFLIDDAFRVGEYVEIGNIRGTVERISLRSFQLRHHNGPLHTVPFGEIQQLTNYSRDWVMMKLPLRLTYDTDPDKVRKLVKKLGIELLDDPEIGKKFLQSLKSQGVFQMEDSAMIFRVKFMTKPGDQFDVRKVVYAKIRELFEREGIKFAHREVTVRVANDRAEGSSVHPKVLAAAALSVIESEGPSTSARSGADR